MIAFDCRSWWNNEGLQDNGDHAGALAALDDETAPSHGRYATTLLGVSHLPAQFLVMLEATAVD